VNEPAVALVRPAGPERLRHERVETEEQPHSENGDGKEGVGADAGRADRLGAEPAHREGVDDPHSDPAKLAEHDRTREREHRAELAVDSVAGRTHGARAAQARGLYRVATY
jgi:hypothetical protein